jgi:hypothetical protein
MRNERATSAPAAAGFPFPTYHLFPAGISRRVCVSTQVSDHVE